jgi:NAD(P)H-flavin reductase
MYEKSIPFEATIKWIKKETRDTSTYALSINSKEIQKIYKFKPGQFNMLYIPGIGEAPVSISSAPSDKELIHTIRVAGDVTTAISKLKPGEIIGVRGPFGTGWPMEEIEESFLLVIAGGLGIAPLRSVFRELSKKRSKKLGAILYGAKTPKDIIFRDELSRYRDFFDIFITVDKADPEEYWKAHIGRVTDLFDKITFNPLDTIVFVCGPEIMMQTVISLLIARGVPAEKIFLSMERNMNCGIGICGHCMFGPKFVCKNGPVFRFSDIEELLGVKEI